MTRISIIIPALNEADHIQQTLGALQPLRRRSHEIIVVDGGSYDETQSLTTGLCDRTIRADKGRARQMNVGAECATGDILLFLHADTVLPVDADNVLVKAIENKSAYWGRFDIDFNDSHLAFRIVAFFMNLRSRISGIATGDQGLFVARHLFDAVGGYPEQPLMEDIELCRRLRKLYPPINLHARVTTSSRRWRHHGILRTIALMWTLRLAYFCGADPAKLAARYTGG